MDEPWIHFADLKKPWSQLSEYEQVLVEKAKKFSDQYKGEWVPILLTVGSQGFYPGEIKPLGYIYDAFRYALQVLLGDPKFAPTQRQNAS